MFVGSVAWRTRQLSALVGSLSDSMSIDYRSYISSGVMEPFRQLCLLCGAVHSGDRYWPTGAFQALGANHRMGVVMFMSSPSQELMDYQVVYRAYGEIVVWRFGSLAEYYGYDSPESTILAGGEYEHHFNWHDNYNRYLEWWQRFMRSRVSLDCFVPELTCD